MLQTVGGRNIRPYYVTGIADLRWLRVAASVWGIQVAEHAVFPHKAVGEILRIKKIGPNNDTLVIDAGGIRPSRCSGKRKNSKFAATQEITRLCAVGIELAHNVPIVIYAVRCHIGVGEAGKRDLLETAGVDHKGVPGTTLNIVANDRSRRVHVAGLSIRGTGKHKCGEPALIQQEPVAPEVTGQVLSHDSSYIVERPGHG